MRGGLEGELKIFTAQGTLEGGLLTGQEGRYGFIVDAGVGPSVVTADGTASFSFLGTTISGTVGVSGGTADVGTKIEFYYDSNTGKFVIGNLSHVGLGVG